MRSRRILVAKNLNVAGHAMLDLNGALEWGTCWNAITLIDIADVLTEQRGSLGSNPG
ncbi:MAG TPA: hypothetical protein VH325_03085 [Bryobacteraceae bacterium]|nr:hypothetical protein [Bryobacteraceae bacterium]